MIGGRFSGPEWNGIAQKETLAGEWPKFGPQKAWEALGAGYSGVAVSQKIAVVFHRLGTKETVTALKADTGEELWSHGYPTTYRPQIEDSNGPRCVPVIADQTVITFGVQGVLSAWELKSGKPLWAATRIPILAAGRLLRSGQHAARGWQTGAGQRGRPQPGRHRRL